MFSFHNPISAFVRRWWPLQPIILEPHRYGCLEDLKERGLTISSQSLAGFWYLNLQPPISGWVSSNFWHGFVWTWGTPEFNGFIDDLQFSSLSRKKKKHMGRASCAAYSLRLHKRSSHLLKSSQIIQFRFPSFLDKILVLFQFCCFFFSRVNVHMWNPPWFPLGTSPLGLCNTPVHDGNDEDDGFEMTSWMSSPKTPMLARLAKVGCHVLMFIEAT